MHFENARFQMLKWDKPSITWENYDKIIISTKWLITQTIELMSHNDCYDTHRSLEIHVWFTESGQVFLRNLFFHSFPWFTFLRRIMEENGGQHKKSIKERP